MCEKKRKIVILRERVWCGLEEVELVHVGRYVKESLRNRVDFATSVARAGSEDQFHSGELGPSSVEGRRRPVMDFDE